MKRSRKSRAGALALSALALATAGCRSAAEAPKAPPAATVENAPKESDLATVTLTPEAEQRLGIELGVAEITSVTRTRTIAGEVVLPPDSRMTVAAPVAGTLLAAGSGLEVGSFVRKGQTVFRLQPYVAPERDLETRLEQEIATAETRVEGARTRLARAEQLVRDKAGPQKNVDQAREELELAEADLRAAREKLAKLRASPLKADVTMAVEAPRDGVIQQVHASPGQTVAGAAPLFEVASVARVWIRVPVYVGEVASVERSQSARIHGLNEGPEAASRAARPVAAPPSADPTAATADLYYELDNAGGTLRPGEKVGVTLVTKVKQDSLVVPWASVLHDVHGGTWVYENKAEHVYARRPVLVREVVGELAALERGPAPGTKVVTAGASELFGTEFGTGK
jgi:RND family efflux transporter MFP subunit